MKQNDWLVAGLLNPEFNTSDFLISGLTPDNTQLLTAEQYKKSQFVRDRFTENGVFNEQAFDDFYRSRASEFGRLQSMDVKDTFVYSPFDTKAKPDSNIQSPQYSIDIVANPTREVDVFGTTHDNGFSQRELAQQSRIWDTEKGEWSTDTVNDRALFSNPGKWLSIVFGDPLVYATYDSDGEHYDTFTGQIVQHKKGEYKLNKYGLPYTETLNGRSLVNKEVVSGFDLLTVDGKGANKYDFFDSDGLDKSVTGTVMKSAAAIAPMFMGPYVAPIYSGLLVGRELMKTFPMLYGLTTAWFDTPAENATLNKLAGIGQALTTGTSDAGKSSMLNMEVLSNMVTDVALQWGQQKAIATSISKLRGSKELVEDAYKKAGTEYAVSRAALEQQASRGTITREALERYAGDASKWQESAIGRAAIQKYMKDVQPIVDRTRRLGADASLVYMALVSNTDVYQSMLEAGASRKEAATVALGSTIGMFSVDRFLGLGELFFDDLTADYERQLRRTLTKEAKSWYDKTVKQTVQEPSKSKLDKFRGLFQKGVDWGKKKTSKFVDDLKYHSTGFAGKAVGEGLEEVGEEFVSDVSKGLYELASDLGFNTTVSDVGAFDNWKERYAMSFLGGTLGGGLFYGVNIYQNGKFHVDQTQDELIYLVRNGKTQDVLKTLDKWRDQGKFGSTSLSINTTKDSEGNDIFLTAENNTDSQNEFIYNRIKETVLQLQNIIDNNDANLNDDELYDKMILSEARFQGLQKYLQGQSYTTNYQQDYQSALNNVVNLEAALTRARKTRTGLPYQSDEEYSRNIATDEQLRNMTEHEKQARDRNIKKVEEDLKSAKEELDRFLSGEYSMEYTEKMLFALDENLNKEFVTMTYDQWLKRAHDGKTPEELSPDEAIQYKEEYLTYKASKQKEDLTKQFELYKAIKAQMDPVLLSLSQNQDKFLKFNQELQALQESNIFNVAPYTFDSVLDIYGETEESDSYKNRNNPESRLVRQEQVKQANIEYAKQLREEILKVIDGSGGFIDPLARRKLKLLLQTRNKDLLKDLQEELKNQMILSNSTIDTDSGQILQRGTLSELDRSVLQLLSSIDLAHLDKANNVWDQIKSLVESSFVAPIRQRNELYGNIRSYIRDARIGDNYDPEEPELTGRALYDMIQYQVDQGRTVDEVFDLNNTELYPDNTETYGGLTRAQLAAFLNDVRARYEAQTRSDNPIVGALTNTNEYLTRSLQQSLDNDENVQRELSYYNGIFQDYLRSVKENPLINLNKELDDRVSNINPVIELVKNLGLHLNTNMDNLEKILTNLDQRYDQVEDIHDLILSPEEKESFEEASQIIRLAQSYLYAASNTPNILRPFGHNATLNEFAENHKDIYKDFQQLPVISQELFNAFDYQLSNYLLQMGVQDPKSKEYNVGSWLYLSNHNEVDKAGQFIRAEKAWNKACYDVFMNHPESFKFEYNGTSYNLLEGAESVPEVGTDTPDAIVYLNQLFNIFHKNIDELVKQGWTYKQIWERSGVLDKLLKINTVPQQKTVSLDQNVTEGNMTYYDKATLLATVAAMDSTKFYAYLRGRVEEENGIVPLTIQEWVSRVGIAELENPEIFNQTLEYVKQKTGDPKPILYNTVYIPGNAGAGKSRVVARNIVKYLKSNNIWLSAPKESQIITLFESTSNGVKMLNRKSSESESSEFPILMEQLGIDQKAYKEALDIMSDENVLSKIEKGEFPQSPNFMIKETNEAYVVEINPDKFGIKKIQNAPEVIVIDEATHLSNLELQILSQFARVNNSKLILLGDSKQKGWNGLGKNIDREQCFTVRAPNLGISLRDDNVQHQFNLRTLEDLINQLSNLDEEDPGYKQQVATIKALLHNIQLKVYNQDEINGEQILTSLTQPYVNKLHGTVGYVGRQPSATLDLLKNSNLEITVLPEVDIQGQEFDYVVIDKDFSIPNKETSDFRLLDFLRDLYTMISRGRKGSIIIDPTGKLQTAIGNNRVEFVKAQAPRIIEYADQFRRQKLDVLDKALGTKQKSEEQQDQGGTEQGTNQRGTQEDQTTPEIILDKDFNVDNLDFNNNYYVIWQVPFTQAGNIQQVGITDAKGLEGNVIFATRDLINQVITTQKEGRGYNGADAIVLMQFPKDTFGTGISDITTITSKVEELDNTDNNIPTKYIKNIIHTIPLDTKDDIKTDSNDTLQPPTPTEADIKEQAIDEDDLPSTAEDVDSDTPSNPILCFGQATFTGMRVEQREKKQVWINPQTETRRDIQIFTDKEEIADTQEQIDLSRKIRALKNAILYRRDYNSLPDYVTKLISKDQFDNIKWHIEVRKPSDQDNFIRNIRFKESEIGIGSKNLMFAVVGEVELNDGTKASVTLGLLSNPKNWINQIGKEGGIRDRIKRKIEKLESRLNGKVVLTQRQKDNIQKKIDKYRTQLDNLDINNPQSEPIQYSNYIEKLTNMYDGEHPVIVPITGLIRPGLTDLHRQQKPVRLARISKALIRSAESRLKLLNQNLAKVKGASIIRARIEEEIEQTKKKLEEFKQIQDVSFRSLNPYTVVSPMYIYTPSSAVRGTADIDDSVVGKCNVVFVTNEEGADPNTLVDKYIAQKKAIEAERQANGVVDLKNSNVIPTVRMVVLNNLGVSFQDMSNPYLAEAMTGEVSYENEGGERVARKQIYPFRTNYMGVRMYVGLWNFRANLLNFKEKFDTFVESLPIDRSLLDDYLRVKDLQWRRDNGRTLSGTEIDYLSKHQNLDKFDEVSKLVDDFNDSLSNQVKEFRLGSDLANGAYVRYLTRDVSALYNTNEKVSGIYINSATFENYLNLAESLFTNVLDQIITCEYPKDRLLSAKEGVRNSFSGYTKTLANTNGVLEIKDYDEEGKVVTKDTIRFGSAYGATGVMNSFSHIPAVLSKVFKYTSLRQTHLSGRNFDTQDRYSIRVQGTIEQDGKEVKIDKVLPYWNIWQYVSMANGQDEYDLHALDNYTWDNNFSNFFSFAFHGTLEDVQDSNAQRATDAFAPKGFFADPLSTTDRVYDGKNKMFTKAVQQQVFFGSDVTVGDPTFFITLGTLKQAVDNVEKQPVVLDTDTTIQQCNDIVTDVSAKYPQLAESFREVLNGIDTIESSQRVEIVQNLIGDIIESEVTGNYNSLFDKAYNVATITPNMLVKKVSNTEAATLQEVLKQQYMEKYNEELSDITGLNRDGNKLVIDARDVSLYVSRQLDGSMSISKIGGPVIHESIVVSEINNLLSALDKVLKQSDKDHLQKNIADYQAVSDDLKQQQKQTIIKTLKRLSSTYMGKREAFKLIKNTINKISEPNCI